MRERVLESVIDIRFTVQATTADGLPRGYELIDVLQRDLPRDWFHYRYDYGFEVVGLEALPNDTVRVTTREVADE